jgi:PPOX class probable F420-dependent enzyme
LQYRVTPTKVEHGWDLAVEGHGTVHSPTLKGADGALREYLGSISGLEPGAVAYVADPPIVGASFEQLMGYVASHKEGALLTIKRDGQPQISNVSYMVAADGTIVIAAAEGRAKVHNLRRDPRASIYVSHDFFSYVQVYGEASVSAAAEHPEDATADRFIEHYAVVASPMKDWTELRRQAVLDRRVLIDIRPIRATGMLSGNS